MTRPPSRSLGPLLADHDHEPVGKSLRPAARLLAFYLPQFHPIPENDQWWGPGFTEWTNTARAKPLFRGHYQPHVPADLGFYDLRVPETRRAQANLAAEYGIEGFCYYHYWFAGRRILERPFDEVLASQQPDFPFCLCWANESWTGIWHGAPRRMLIEQTYPGPDDHKAHFETLLPAFLDSRYIRVDDRPVFLIYKPEKLPDPMSTTELWRQLAHHAGLPGLFLVGTSASEEFNPKSFGFDAKVCLPLVNARSWISRRHPIAWLRQRFQEYRGLPVIYAYQDVMLGQGWSMPAARDSFPCVVHAWDNTPRSGKNGVVLKGTCPELFTEALRAALTAVQPLPHERRLIFLKSWNEWAEGNHLEPDLRYGQRYLEAVKASLFECSSTAPCHDEPATVIARHS